MLQPGRTSSPSLQKAHSSDLFIVPQIKSQTFKSKLPNCCACNFWVLSHEMCCSSHGWESACDTLRKQSGECQTLLEKKTFFKSYSSSQLAQCGGAKSSRLSRIWKEGFLLPLAQKQHFVLCALFILETLLDKLLEGIINCKDLSVFPKQSRC